MTIKAVAFVAVLAIIMAGCSKSPIDDTSPPASTLRIADSCLDKESCCAKDCGDHCVSQSAKYEKHIVNGPTCACFCSR